MEISLTKDQFLDRIASNAEIFRMATIESLKKTHKLKLQNTITFTSEDHFEVLLAEVLQTLILEILMKAIDLAFNESL